MIELRVLGGVELRGARGDGATILTQSKLLAALVFLALATPRGFHRRDRMVGLLWPELDQAHARTALRKAVHGLRRALGDASILVRGDEELALAPDAVRCDAVEFTEAVSAKHYAHALDLYRRGDLLPGFFVSEAGEFEDWLERERTAMRDLASAAAWGLATVMADGADLTVAGRYARMAAELAPADERMLRRVMVLLHRIGDRAGALHAFAEFARRMQREFGVAPSDESLRLLAEVRGDADSVGRR
ncbi:MAG: BTAD domain-containing putative transcriptional regulator [Gemmatimonadaceae bacterium]